jgi:hypothetical protein
MKGMKIISRLFRTENCLRILLLFFMSLSFVTRAGTDANEYNVKAMFVLNFMKYVDWPENNSSETFNIGVAGESEIYNALVIMISSRQENNRIKITRITGLDTFPYQIVIIPRSENRNIEEWSKKYQGKGVLLISEECKSPNYAAINLLNINNKIRFEINHSQARACGIKISSRLAEFAVKVHP